MDKLLLGAFVVSNGSQFLVMSFKWILGEVERAGHGDGGES